MNRLKFEPTRHRYTLDDRPITGVTTILGVIAKHNLIQWAADMAAVVGLEAKQIIGIKKEYDEIQKIYDWQEKKIARDGLDKKYPEYKQARTAHAQKRDMAGDIGTAVHGECENWIRTEYLKLKPKENPEYDGVKDKAMADKMIKNFKDWAIKNKVKFVASEERTYNEKYFFCGTYDFLCEISGKVWLGDIKTSSNIYSEVWAQMAGYHICEEERKPEQKIDGYIVINLKKNGEFNEKRSLTSKEYKDFFLAALKIYRVQQKIKNVIL